MSRHFNKLETTINKFRVTLWKYCLLLELSFFPFFYFFFFKMRKQSVCDLPKSNRKWVTTSATEHKKVPSQKVLSSSIPLTYMSRRLSAFNILLKSRSRSPAQLYRGADTNLTNSKAERQEFFPKITSWHIFSWKEYLYFSWVEQPFRRNCCQYIDAINLHICSCQVTPALWAHFTKRLPNKSALLKWNDIFLPKPNSILQNTPSKTWSAS